MRLGYIRDTKSLKEVIDRIAWRQDGTAFGDALRQAADQFEKERRPNAEAVLVLYSDGNTKMTYQEMTEIGSMLRKKGISLRIVTTGEDGEQLKPLAPDGITSVNLTDGITELIRSKIAIGILTGTWKTLEIISRPFIRAKHKKLSVCLSTWGLHSKR